MIATALGCALPSPAPAAGKSATFKQLTLTGSLTFTWTGDPARGCAVDGLCGIDGELSLSIPSGSSQSFSGPGLSYVQPNVSGVVRVRRASGGSVSECVEPTDVFSQPVTIDFSRDLRRALIQSTWSSGRCAGPVAGEVPSFRLAVRRSGGQHPSFDLSGTRSLDTGPFAVTVISNLRLSSSPPTGFGSYSSSSSSGSSGSFSPPVRHVQIEYVRLRYRLLAPPSDLEVSFRGSADPLCEMLDSCGAAGALTLSLAPLHTSFTLTASRVVNRRVSASGALADFLRGRLGLQGGVPETMSGRLAETLEWGENASCSDSRRVFSLALLLGPFAPPAAKGPLVPMSLQDVGGQGLDLLRTNCPGPSDADVFGTQPLGSQPIIAAASVSRRRLLARQTSIVLSPAGSFSGLGYAGARGGAVRLELTLLAVKAGTRVETR